MSHVSDRFAVVLDANVLYPFLVRDVLLSLAEAGFYRPLWSQTIMDEWQTRLIARMPQHESKIRRTARRMNEAFPEAMVENYETLIPALSLPDPGDRHVLAAAIKAGAHAIITENLSDFPSATLNQYEIEVRSADEFIANTVELYPDGSVGALRSARLRYNNPPLPAEDLILAMAKRGLVETAAMLQSRLSVL